MKKLRLRTQTSNITCMSTSLAMLLDMDAQQCADLYHDKLYSQDFWFDDILDELGVPYEYPEPGRNSIKQGHVYLCVVASLNHKGGLHQLVIDYRNDDFVVLDPNTGRDCLAYQPDGSDLFGWRVDLILPSSLWSPDGNNDQPQCSS